MKRVGIYVRVSTQDQSCDLQKRELTEYCQRRGWTSFVIYEDMGSGTNGNRTMLKQLLVDSRTRKLDIVLCWKLDRFFRSLKDLVITLQDLNSFGVEFISLKDNVDLTSSAGRLMLHLLGAFGEFEASLIQERVRAGLRVAKANGTKLGRPITIDPEAVLLLRRQGLSLSEIAQRLGVSRSGVHKTLSSSSRNPSANLLKDGGTETPIQMRKN